MVFSISFAYQTKAFHLKKIKMEKLKKKLKNVFNPKDVYSTHRPMLLTYCFEGLFPFRLNKDRAELRFSKIGFSLTLIQLTLYFLAFFLTIFVKQSFVVYFFQTEIAVICGYLQFAISCVAVVSLYSVAIIRRHKIRLVFQSLYDVDKRFKDLHQEIDHKAAFRLILIGWMVLYSLNLTFVLLSFLLLGSEKRYPSIVVWYSFFFPYLILTLVVVKFVTVMKQIEQRFRALAKVRSQKLDFLFLRSCEILCDGC